MIRTLSGGMKRRISLAISALGDPKVIFMDEPTTGVNNFFIKKNIFKLEIFKFQIFSIIDYEILNSYIF